MIKRKMSKGQTIIYKTSHGKLKMEQYEGSCKYKILEIQLTNTRAVFINSNRFMCKNFNV